MPEGANRAASARCSLLCWLAGTGAIRARMPDCARASEMETINAHPRTAAILIAILLFARISQCPAFHSPKALRAMAAGAMIAQADGLTAYSHTTTLVCSALIATFVRQGFDGRSTWTS